MESESQKRQVQRQFGASANAYAESDVHARGESLRALVDSVPVQSNWQMLDVATGAGHTALAFAPLVGQVVAADITAEMLTKTIELAKRNGVSNIETVMADAEQLPFADASFDFVTCRLAMHHFQNVPAALSEFHRVLRPNGWLGVTDNVTVEDEEAAEFYNRYERIRDPSHRVVVSFPEFRRLLSAGGFSIENSVRFSKEFEFNEWADRQHVSQADKKRLLTMMSDLPAGLDLLFSPRFESDTMYFTLWEAVVTGTKATTPNGRG